MASEVRSMNPVQANNSWKDSVNVVMKNQLRIWPVRWTFIVDLTNEMYEAMEGKRPWSPFDSNKTYPIPPPPEPDQKAGGIFLPPIVMPPPSSYPRTTTGLYGWRPMGPVPALLEQRLTWIKTDRSRGDLVKNLKWPGPMP